MSTEKEEEHEFYEYGRGAGKRRERKRISRLLSEQTDDFLLLREKEKGIILEPTHAHGEIFTRHTIVHQREIEEFEPTHTPRHNISM